MNEHLWIFERNVYFISFSKKQKKSFIIFDVNPTTSSNCQFHLQVGSTTTIRVIRFKSGDKLYILPIEVRRYEAEVILQDMY